MSELSERYRNRAKECRRLAGETGDEIAADSLTHTAEMLDEAALEIEEEETGERSAKRSTRPTP